MVGLAVSRGQEEQRRQRQQQRRQRQQQRRQRQRRDEQRNGTRDFAEARGGERREGQQREARPRKGAGDRVVPLLRAERLPAAGRWWISPGASRSWSVTPELVAVRHHARACRGSASRPRGTGKGDFLGSRVNPHLDMDASPERLIAPLQQVVNVRYVLFCVRHPL